MSPCRGAMSDAGLFCDARVYGAHGHVWCGSMAPLCASRWGGDRHVEVIWFWWLGRQGYPQGYHHVGVQCRYVLVLWRPCAWSTRACVGWTVGTAVCITVGRSHMCKIWL